MADKDITTGLTKTTVLTTGDYVYAVDGGNSRGILFENFIASIRTLNGSGADGTLVTGTAGTSGNLASWNVDGDAVDSGIAAANVLVDADIGVAVQAYDAQLADVAGLTPTDGNFIVGNGTNFVAESGATARTSIGLGNVENTALSTWTGTSTIVTVGTLSSGDATGIVSAASDTAAGKVELATAAETTTGTDTGRAVTPDGLAGSIFGTQVVQILVFDDSQDTAVADGAGDVFFRVPSTMNGMNLVGVAACVQTAGTTGTTDIQIHNVTQAADMLTTKITIDSGETDSSTAATAAVIDTANDDVATGDRLRIDVDAVSTTAAKGLLVELQFRLP